MNKNKKKASPLNDKLMSQLKGIVKVGLREGMSAAGGVAGTYMGNPAGGRKVGKKLAARLSKLIGSGDYASNTTDLAVNSLIKPGANQYATFGDNTSCVRIQHREYVRDVFAGAPGSFSFTSVPVNPGLKASFPYLAGLAQNFEEYRLNGMVFEIVSTTSPYNSTSAMGSTIVAMQYNAASPPFTSKAQMENSDFAISARLDKSIMYGIECKDLASNNLFIRDRDISSSVPLTSTDVGLLQVALQTGTGIPSGSVIGELWVSYDIDLMRPHVSTSSAGGDFMGQLKVYNEVDSSAYITSLAGSVALSNANGSLSNVRFVDTPLYTDIYEVTPLIQFPSIAGHVYMVQTISTGVGAYAYVTVNLSNSTSAGTYPSTYSGMSTAKQQFFEVTSTVNGMTDLTMQSGGGTTANTVLTINIIDCGSSGDFTFLQAIA